MIRCTVAVAYTGKSYGNTGASASRGAYAAIGVYHPDRAPFFPNHKGRCYNSCPIGCWFHELLDAADPAVAAAPGSPPRLYDLRHAHVRSSTGGRAPGGTPKPSLHI